MKATEQALSAVRAVKSRKVWGNYAAVRYAQDRGAFLHFIVACEFELRRKT